MNGRRYIEDSITLQGVSNGARFDRTFRIVRVISEGSDGVCYEAYHEKSGVGVLKEFYPRGAIGTERNDKGQLVHTSEFGSSLELFRRTKEEFIRPYEMLLDIKQRDPGSDIATFIPPFEIYYGIRDGENTEGTVYIWTPQPQIVTFDRICDGIHSHPDVRPEHKLVQVLSAMETLTKCVCALHKADIIHRDIKPSNFGFLSRGGEALTQAISLFDIDSLCSIWADDIAKRGTVGYIEPEAEYEDCSNQTDIYSIGATLFSAIIISDETREGGFIYRDKYFTHLKYMVDTSELITASESNSHPRLRAILTSILRRSLCGRTSRYESCEAMLADIQEAMFYALPYDSAGKRRSPGGRWVLADAEKSLDAYADRNSFLQILYHLYREPLYARMEEGETVLRVAVAGFDIYGQKFLDACLQNGQMPGVHLDMDVFYGDETDRDLYLEERPELPAFFNITGAACGKPDGEPYGDIHFIRASAGGQDADEEAITAAACGNAEKKAYHYAFISLGTDASDRRGARAFRKAAEKAGGCTVSFVCRDKAAGTAEDGICPVYVNAGRSRSAAIREIERMAFNTHLVWGKGSGAGRRETEKAFRRTYNHDSSVSGVISLKYKLRSLGIKTGECAPEEAAEKFRQLIEADSSGNIRSMLMWAEHRRWVTEKICRGWTRIEDPDSCVDGGTKNEKARRHVCIVRSRPDQLLADMTGDKDPGEAWDSFTEKEIASLDDLDRLSVMLHRAYKKRASEITRKSIGGSRLLAMLRSGAAGDPGLEDAFGKWYGCIEAMWNGDSSAAPLYEELKEAFIQAAAKSGDEISGFLKMQAEAFDSFFRPVRESMKCRDWKQTDADIIDSIPFILTNRDKNICL